MVWSGFTLDWYVKMAKDKNLMLALATSVKVALASSAISAVLGTLGAYAVGKFGKRVQTLVSGFMYVPLMIPEIIMGVALLLFFSVIPVRYGMPTLIISHTTFCLPYIFIMVSVRLKTIDPSVIEAARDLGASRAQVFFTVILPLIIPAVLTGSLLSLAMSFDDVVISFFLDSPETPMLPVQIFSMLKLGVTPSVNALFSVIFFTIFLIVGIYQVLGRRVFNRHEENPE